MLEYWGAFGGNQLEAVLMRYGINWTAWWTEPGEFVTNFVSIISQYPDVTNITGRPDIIVLLDISGYHIKDRYSQHMAVMGKFSPPPPVCDVRWATSEEIDEIVELYADDDMPRSREGLLRRITEGGLAVGHVDERMVTAAAITARAKDSAMLGGVWTLPQYRNRGYGSWCTAWICGQLLGQGVTPTLFYHNPAAGSIYRRLGFQEIGPYAMVTLEKTGN